MILYPESPRELPVDDRVEWVPELPPKSIERTTKTIDTTRLKLVCNPRWVLLFDAIGAVLTALTAVLLLASKRLNTGLPTELLVAMGVAAVGFACFDVASLLLRADPSRSLRAIAVANAGYCGFVVTALYVYRSTVTGLGLFYFCLEIPLIAFIAAWEWRIARR